ncbi:MAG: TIGR00701 family protein [Oceanospirillaceae bacterium]|nr:TIGR00701 family protein [Oceanospirillaceae bacterium]|tara:strand:- start:1565 stop:1993 length:429 start_codon:yes stop_codon:yes gene_type:complete
MLFLWLKAFHIIAVITWMAGIFYLPRLFVYHADATDTVSSERFKVMERKLYRGIMNPSMMVAVALGIWMILLNPDFYMSQGWMHAKLTMAVLMIGYHIWCGRLLRRFRDDQNTHSHVFYRWFNEAPVFLLLGIVIMVVVRPF